MQTTIDINGQPVQITLTKDQVEQVMKASKDDAQTMYEAASAQLGRKIYTLEDFAFLPEEDRQAFYSLYRITTAIKAQKKGVKLDYANGNQKKHYPWFLRAGSGFSLLAVDYAGTLTAVGARLSSKDVEDVKAVVNAMQKDYNNWLSE